MTEAELRELSDKLQEAADEAWWAFVEDEADGDWREDDYYSGLDEDLYL